MKASSMTTTETYSSDMENKVFVSWLEVAEIGVTDDITPSPAIVEKTVAKLARRDEKDTSVVVRPLGEESNQKSFELVTGRREYEASRWLGRTLIPCKIVEISDEEAANLRRLDALMEPRAANEVIRGWELIDAADQHGWDRADLTSFLPVGRSQVWDAWAAAEALPRTAVAARCRANGLSPNAVSQLTRAHIRKLRDISDDERLDVLLDHLQPSAESGSALDGQPEKTDKPEVDQLVVALVERLRQRPWRERAVYVIRLVAMLLRRADRVRGRSRAFAPRT